jgi:hypothetical protein
MAEIPVERKGTSAWWLWLLLGLLAIGLLIWLAVDALDIGQARPAAPDAAPANATLATYAATPREFYGKTVTISGEITDVVGLNAVTLGDRVLVITKRQLLDAQGKPLQTTVTGRDVMQVTGTAREFDLAAFEKEAGIDLEDAKFTRWAGKPAIIATDWQMRTS